MIQEYINPNNRNPFAKWFNRLDPKAAAKVTAALTRMEQGNFSQVKSVGGGVRERRIHFGPSYRIYFGKDGDDLIILLGGGTKKRQQKDIEAARDLWQEYKQRKSNEA